MPRTLETALVTGASAGLGREFANLFAKDGHDLVLVARRKERLDELAGDLRDTWGVEVQVVAQDLGERGAAREVVEALGETKIDFLVNNAGFGSNGAFWELPAEMESAMVQVNITALLELTRLLLPAMVERKRGRILNVGSTAGFQPGPYMATYYATKAFVNSFTEALAIELEGTGVSATVSCPGPVDTEFAKIAGNDTSNLFKSGVATPEQIAAEAYAAMMKGRALCVHGMQNKLALQVQRVAPRKLVQKIAAKLNKHD